MYILFLLYKINKYNNYFFKNDDNKLFIILIFYKYANRLYIYYTKKIRSKENIFIFYTFDFYSCYLIFLTFLLLFYFHFP